MTMLVQPDLGSVGRETPVPLQTARSGPDALQALELELPKAAYSTVVLAGLVTASEWLAIALAGAIALCGLRRSAELASTRSTSRSPLSAQQRRRSLSTPSVSTRRRPSGARSARSSGWPEHGLSWRSA